jgi:hypothetical protein
VTLPSRKSAGLDASIFFFWFFFLLDLEPLGAPDWMHFFYFLFIIFLWRRSGAREIAD